LNVATAILGMILTLIVGLVVGLGFGMDDGDYDEQGYTVEHQAAELEALQHEYDQLEADYGREVREWERAWEEQSAALIRAERTIRELDAEVQAHRQAMIHMRADLWASGIYGAAY
jgi:uncharacterized membrane protein YraQ (UPF0718 family)